jgi:hypothetical protein
MAQRNKRENDVDPSALASEAFSRCSNWPQDRSGQIGLAQGLKMAAIRFGFTMAEIIAVAREASAFCPTDFDLLSIARDMRRRVAEVEGNELRQHQRADWEAEYGPPSAIAVDWEPDKSAEAKRFERDNQVRDIITAKRGGWPGWAKVSWREIYECWRDLGWELTKEQQELAGFR